jgi:superoxide reductase
MEEKIGQIYKCAICGNIVELIKFGGGELVCCGQPMELLVEKNKDVGNEKHVPIIERNNEGIIVKVGKIPHPMEKEHYIQWIEIKTEKGNSRKFLKPGDKPEASFPIKIDLKKISARIYCNIHGLWKSG